MIVMPPRLRCGCRPPLRRRIEFLIFMMVACLTGCAAARRIAHGLPSLLPIRRRRQQAA
jgi:hypothetical protein